MNDLMRWLQTNGLLLAVLVAVGAAVVFSVVDAVDKQPAPEPAPQPQPGPTPAPKPEPQPEPAPEPNPRVLEWYTDKDEALAEAAKIGGVVVGYYARRGCPYCTQLCTEYLETIQFRRRCINSKIVPYYVGNHQGQVPVLKVCSPNACVEPLSGWRGVAVTDDWLRQAAESAK